MNARGNARLSALLLAAAALGATAAPPAVTTLAAGSFVLATAAGNLLVHVGPRDALVIGALTPEGRIEAERFLGSRQAPPVRFVIAADGPGVAANGDAGWGRRGAVVLAHERLRARMAATLQETAAGATVPGALPELGFSDVQQALVSDDEAHAVHQWPGYSDADASVHLERGGVVYLGPALTTDGYPAIDLEDGGSIDGLIRTASHFSDGFGAVAAIRYVPARGPVVDGAGLDDYLALLRTARDRIQPLVAMGLSDADIVKANPLADQERRWGHGPVGTAEFTSLVARSLRGH